MTFPAMVQATQSPISGFLALAVGAVVAWRGGSLFLVAVSACAAVFLCELLYVYLLERSSAQNPRCSNAYTRRTGR